MVPPEGDALSLGSPLAGGGAAGMIKVIPALEQDSLVARPQPAEGVSRAPKLTRELGRLDWPRAAVTLHNLIRGLVPWPGATAIFRDQEVKIWRTTVWTAPPLQPPGTVTAVGPEGLSIACGKQQLLIHELQPANRRRMAAWDFVQGYRVCQGERFA